MTMQPNPATSGEVLVAVMAFMNDLESARATGRQSIISSPDYAAQRFAMKRLDPAIQAQLDADEAAFRAAYETLTLPTQLGKTGSQDATARDPRVLPLLPAMHEATGWYVWRVSPGGGQEQFICSVPDEAYGRRYVDWLNTHPNNRRSKAGRTSLTGSQTDRFELRAETLTCYAPPLPSYTEVRPYDRNDVFPG